MNRLVSSGAAALIFAVAAGCSGSSNSADPSSQPSPSSSPSAAPSPTPPSPTAPSPTASTPPAPPTTTARTAKQLTAALLALSDLPAGLSIEPDQGSSGDNPVVSSKDPKCAKLIALTNADTPPGSKVSVSRSFSGGEQGPFIDEGLDAMGSPAAVQALQQTFRKAITSCKSLGLSLPGQGRSPISVREVSAPKAGTNPVAVRYSAISGPLEGLEITMVTTGIQDVVLSVTVVAGLPDDIDGATMTAAEKATQALGGAKTGA